MNEAPATADGVPEIEESQHTEPEAQQGADEADEGSPLFVRGDTPDADELPSQPSVAVHNPDPPSSFYEGAYQAVSSSQVDPVVSQSKRSPEPSQYFPEDTTATTESTTEVTFAPTTPSEPSRSAPLHEETTGASVDGAPDAVPGAANGLESRATAVTQAEETTRAPSHSSNQDDNSEPGPSDARASTTRNNRPSTPANIYPAASEPRRVAEDSSYPQSNKLPFHGNPEQLAGSLDAVSEHRELQNSCSEQKSQSQHNSQSALKPESQDYIDLATTTQEPSTSGQPFSITPPPRRTPDNVGPGTGAPLASSSWLGSPFKTQISLQSGVRLASQNDQDTNSERPQTQPSRDSRARFTQSSTFNPRAFSVPAEHSHSVFPSSIESPPSQSIRTGQFGNSVAPPPSAPSTPEPRRAMENQSTPTSGGSLQERMDALRAAIRSNYIKPKMTASPAPPVNEPASSPQLSIGPTTQPTSLAVNPAQLASPMLAAQDGARSPSAVPASAPLPEITLEEMNTSERYETLLPQTQDLGAGEGQRNGSLTASAAPAEQREGGAADNDPEKASMYTIPIALSGHQRDQYPSTVWLYRKAVERYLASSNTDQDLPPAIEQLLQCARNVAMHPDLDDVETLTQHDTEASQQAEWDVKCSAKFRFLRELVDHLRDQELHIAIYLSPSPLVGILDTFFRGIGVHPDHANVDRPQDVQNTGKLRVTLVTSDDEVSTVAPANLVIAMDFLASFDRPIIRALRYRQPRWAPFVSIVVPYTVEHVERCLSPYLSGRAKHRALVSGTYQLRTYAGRLEGEQLTVNDSAAALAGYLTSTEKNPEWPLVALHKLEDFDSQTESDIEYTEDGIAGNKRSRVEGESAEDEEPTGAKRARFSSQDVQVTHISDSVEQSTQTNALGQPAEVAQPAATITEQRLQDRLAYTQDRLREHEQALADLQYRHEEQRNNFVEVNNERNAAITTAQHAVERLNEQATIRAKVRELEQQLKEANERLVDHSVPERAEFEALRIAATDVAWDKQKVEKRLEQAEKDLAYIRDLYQSSSSSAQQLATQNAELEAKLAVAETRATGEQAKLRQMGYDAYTKNLEKENKKHKALLTDREAGMKFRDEEVSTNG